MIPVEDMRAGGSKKEAPSINKNKVEFPPTHRWMNFTFDDRRMKKFYTDRIAIVTALVGIILMVLTIIWRINPVEGSVIPRFLTGNPLGVAVICVLLATCMPAWIVAVSVCMLLPFAERTQDVLACVAMLMLQGVSYFMVGKLISVCVRKVKREKDTSNKSMEATPDG
jgi:hypothetical protein